MTLVGTSLGARLIFACLEEIARRHELWEEQVRCFGALSCLVAQQKSRFRVVVLFLALRSSDKVCPRSVYLNGDSLA